MPDEARGRFGGNRETEEWGLKAEKPIGFDFAERGVNLQARIVSGTVEVIDWRTQEDNIKEFLDDIIIIMK